jgi:hypothetical protein
VLRRLLTPPVHGRAPLAPPLPEGWDEVDDEHFYARGHQATSPGLFAKWVSQAMSRLW